MLQPTPLNLRLIAAGIPIALLPTLVDVRLWIVWVAMVGGWALLSGLDAILLPRTAELRWTLELPVNLYIGRTQTARLAVEGITDGRAEALLDLSDEADPLEAAPLTAGEADLAIRPRRRGTLQVARAWIRNTGPLGLMRRVSALAVDRQVPIVHDTPRVQSEALRFFGGRHHTGVKVERFSGDGSESTPCANSCPAWTVEPSTGRPPRGTPSSWPESIAPSATTRSSSPPTPGG